MNEKTTAKPDYGNWVSPKVISLFTLTTVFFAVTSLVFWPFLLGAILCLVPVIYFWYAHYQFSPKGGDIQHKIRSLVLNHLKFNGKGRALDIGCGNGALGIELTKKYTAIQTCGIDYWGSRWDYSQKACETNASLEGVNNRITFQRASASKLPFSDECFDLAVSNFVFHEVADVKDKRELIKEALRVVKKGGSFAFQDLFLIEKFYGNLDDLLHTIGSWGISKVHFIDTSNSEFIPAALKLPFMVGKIGIICGIK